MKKQVIDLNKDVGEGDPILLAAMLKATDKNGKIDWKMVECLVKGVKNVKTKGQLFLGDFHS